MRFDTLDLVDDNYLLVLEPCGCRGNPECDCANGVQIAGAVDLTILLRNLAVAGALCAAFSDGWQCRIIVHPSGLYEPWRPGCGREVPR